MPALPWDVGGGQEEGSVSVLAEFSRYQRAAYRRPNTIDRRQRVLRAFAEWLQQPPDRATTEDIEAWLATKDLVPWSLYNYISTLGVFFDWCVMKGLREDNPTASMARPPLPRLIPRPVDTEELRAAVSEADERMRAWLLLCSFQGLRCHEVTYLHAEDVVVNGSKLLYVRDGKGGHQRVLPLHDRTLGALRAFGLPPKGPVFRSQRGREFDPSTVSGYIGSHFREVDSSGTAHQCRHWFACQLYLATHDLGDDGHLHGVQPSGGGAGGLELVRLAFRAVRPMGPSPRKNPSPDDSTEALLYACWKELRTIRTILFWVLVVVPICVGLYLGLSA
jgi:site-specific recombinase XerD